MGPSEIESKQTSLEMGSEHQRETSDGLKINPENHTAHEKKLSSSSSSSSCSFEDTRPSPGEIASPDHAEGTRLASEENKDGVSGGSSPIPRHDQDSSNASNLNTESATQSPPKQLMERPADTADATHRIPSSIFTRKSSAANDWSIASNESLFSIHMGNMSFTREQANWLAKSGELGLMGDFSLSSPLSPMIEFSITRYSSNHSLSKKYGEIEQPTAAKGAETMREADADKQKPHVKISHLSSSFRRSDVSSASVKSFAFPILTGDHKTDNSQKRNAHLISQNHTSSNEAEETEKLQEGTSSPEPIPKPAPVQAKWFSCLPCCSSCT